MRLRQLLRCVVSQMCVMSAGPVMSVSSNMVCPWMSTLGEIFQPGPRCAAAAAPVPSVARPPPPLAPSKFSGLIDRDCAPLRSARERRSITPSSAVVGQPVAGILFGLVGRMPGRIATDVDTPPGEPCGQPRVLALLPDGQRQLEVGHHHTGGFGGL